LNSAEETTQPFYERRLFQGTAALVALATALLALVGPLRDAIDGVSPDPPKRGHWVEVVLNTSSAMGERFGEEGGTRLEAAAGAIAKAVKELDNSGVGLRSTPASCGDESKPLVDLADGSPDEVIREAQRQRPNGNASIVDAVIGALDEFDREPMQSHGPESRSLFVFTTAGPPCPLDDPTGEVERRLEEAHLTRFGSVEVFALTSSAEQNAAGIAPSEGPMTKLVAMEVADEEIAALGAIESVLGTQATIHYVDSPSELYSEAEAAGEDTQETAERSEEEGETGTSDEGEPE